MRDYRKEILKRAQVEEIGAAADEAMGSECFEKQSLDIEEPDTELDSSPSPEDYVIRSNGFKYFVGQVEGKFLGEFVEIEDAENAIREKMNREKYWPSVWFESDHGNISPHVISAAARKTTAFEERLAKEIIGGNIK